jgi:hypothetical protein
MNIAEEHFILIRSCFLIREEKEIYIITGILKSTNNCVLSAIY